MRRIAICLLLAGCSGPSSAPPGAIRAIGVTRLDYKSPDDVRRIFEECAGLGVNTVFFQGRDVPVVESRRLGLSVHAWLTLEDDATHPERVAIDKEGKPLGRLNPRLPAVRDHIVGLAREAAARGVDGIHLDLDFDGGSYDEKTLSLFGFITGGTPEEKPAEWRRFCVLAVGSIVEAVRKAVPRTRLTAVARSTGDAWPVDALFVVEAAGPGVSRIVSRDGLPVEAGARVAIYPVIDVAAKPDEIERKLAGARGFALLDYGRLFGDEPRLAVVRKLLK